MNWDNLAAAMIVGVSYGVIVAVGLGVIGAILLLLFAGDGQ